MSEETKIWVSECPRIGQRIVFSASNHKGASQSGWMDGKVIQVGRVPNATTNWIVEVEYLTTKKKRWGGYLMHRRWCSAADVMAVIDENSEVQDLEKLFKM